MSSFQQDSLDVDALMRQIRSDIAAASGSATASGKQTTGPNSGATVERSTWQDGTATLSRLAEPAAPIERKRSYTVRDFLDYHDEDFICNAYRGLLGREPDAEGARRFLDMLRHGQLSKAEILGRIRLSPEGRAAGIRVTGLAVPFTLRTIRRVPILGQVLGIIQYFFRLPNIVKNHERLEALVFLHRLELRRGIDAISAETESALRRLHDQASASGAKLEAVEQQASVRADALTARLKSMTADIGAKADRQDTAMLEQRLRSDIESRNARHEEDRAALENRLSSEVNALSEQAAQRAHALEEALRNESEARASQGETLTKNAGDIAIIRTQVDALEQWRYDRPSSKLLTETIRVAAVAKADIASIAGELTVLRAEVGRADISLDATRNQASRIDVTLAALDASLLTHQRHLIEHERRLLILSEKSAKLTHMPPDAGPGSEVREGREGQDSRYDSFYASFEDVFRGTREDIKQRVEIYLDYVRGAEAGTIDAPVLDIGCGRGEWLELLNDNGLMAMGVDTNRVSAESCRERGLLVTEGDALEYLRGLHPGSIGAVTAIHVIEHVSFPQLMLLFDEVRRVLKPGGIAIFETPNPENLVVGACTFWSDPTHQRPLPPEPMRFVLGDRGFINVEVVRLHPVSAGPQDEAAPQLAAIIAEKLFGPQDYALIAYTPFSAARKVSASSTLHRDATIASAAASPPVSSRHSLPKLDLPSGNDVLPPSSQKAPRFESSSSGVERLDAMAEEVVRATLEQLRMNRVHDDDFNAFKSIGSKPVRLIMDVGANRGQSVASLKSIFPSAVIHAFEANPMFFSGLGALARRFPETLFVHCYGLGSSHSNRKFYIPWVGSTPYLEESSTLLDYFEAPWVVEKFRARGEMWLKETMVELRRGDDLAIDPDIVKIDVEGAERDVLVGLTETLRRARPILLVENSDWHSVTAFLEPLDFLPFRWEGTTSRFVPFYGETTNTFYFHKTNAPATAANN